jgi:LuxR family maltose regulon positive regulatory protein
VATDHRWCGRSADRRDTLNAVVTPRTRRPLIERLAAARFAIVSAPAGFGKTAAIRDALDVGATAPGQHGTASTVVAWARLGTAFRTDAATIATGLLEVARQLGATGESEVEVEDRDRLGASAGTRIAAVLDRVVGPSTLVLDDLHLVTTALQDEIATILRRWPSETRQLIVSTRGTLSAIAATWPIHEADAIIAPPDLLLDDRQIADTLGPDLVGSVGRVAQATGGWALGVDVMQRHLAADSTDGVERAEVVLHALIAAEILPQLAAADLDELMMLSLCDAVRPSVAVRASLRSTTAGRLRALADETAFVVADGDVIGLIPIFRQALVKRMTTLDPGAVTPAHLRFAHAWLDEPATASSTSDAVHHLLEAGEFAHAVDVLKQRWGVLYTASRVDVLVELMERIPVRYWANDAGSALLLGWANLLVGRGTRALELIQSPPLRTPAGAAIKRLVWAQGVWWSTGPAEALQLVAEGRSRLDQLEPGEPFPHMPGNDDGPAFRIVADGAEIRARFLLGDLAGSIDRLDALVAQPSQLEPVSVAGLHALGALIRAFRGDRNEAIVHLENADSLMRQLGVDEHYVMFPGHLARALLAVVAGDAASAAGDLSRAVVAASDCGAANFQRLCELVADMGGLPFTIPSPELAKHSARLPFVDSQLPARSARRRADLGDTAGAASMLKGLSPNELALGPWVHVLLMRHPIAEVRSWLSAQPDPVCAHGQVVRLLAEATVADTAALATQHARRAAAIAADRRLLGVISDAPAALWERPEIARLDLPIFADAQRLLRDEQVAGELRFTTREIELLQMLARSATASEIAGQLYVSINTVKWHKANVYRKLGVSGRRLAVERAVDLGLVDPDGLH